LASVSVETKLDFTQGLVIIVPVLINSVPMNAKNLLCLGAVALGFHFQTTTSFAATVIWTGAGDGISWTNLNNWSNNVLPTVTDDVLIGGVGTNTTLVLGGSFAVQSVQCSASLSVSGGSLSLSGGPSQVAGIFTIASGQYLLAYGSNTTFLASGPANVDDGNFTVSGGGVVTLPTLKNYNKSCNGGYWTITDANSVLALPALTNITGQACSYPVIQVAAGGQLLATNLASIAAGPLGFQADGTNSLIDFSGLTACAGQNPYLVTFEASAGGTLRIPRMTGGPFVGVTLNVGGTLPTAQLTQLTSLALLGITANLDALTSVGNLTVAGVMMNFPALSNANDANFTVSAGALVTLPALQNYTKQCNGAYWTVTGSNSVLALPALTNITGQACNYPVIQAEAGGQLIATNLASIAAGPLGFQADGTNSLIDLSGLTACAGQSPYLVTFEASDGGTLRIPQMAGGLFVGVTLNPGGILPTAQIRQLTSLALFGATANFDALTNVANLTVTGVTMNFPTLNNVNDGNFTVSAGAVVTLPALQNYTKQCNGGYWSVTGSNSVLALPALTNITGQPCNYPVIQAEAGGQLLASNLASIAAGPLGFQADGTNSLIDFSALATCAGQNPFLVTFEASAGGTLRMPLMTGGPFVGVTLNSGGILPTAQIRQLEALTLQGVTANFDNLTTLSGQTTISGVTMNFPALTNFDGGNITISGGAVVTMPAVQNYAKECNSPNWTVTGSNSLLSVPGLTNISGPACGFPTIEATAGGQVLATNLGNILAGPLTVLADGAGSVVNMSGLLSGAGESGYPLSFVAQNAGALMISSCGVVNLVSITAQSAGFIDMSLVQGISGSSCAITADGAVSVINLSNLSAFATPAGASSLIETNGGTVLLNNDVFLLVNVAVSITGNPALPPIVSAGPSLSLYGLAWHSYEVDWRDTRVAGSPWQLYRRVPLTNDIEVVGGPPDPWQDFRVEEFVANPAILDLNLLGGQTGQVVLYAATNQTFRVESTPSVNHPVVWSPFSGDFAMTNSFRILGPFPTTAPMQFFRWRQP